MGGTCCSQRESGTIRKRSLSDYLKEVGMHPSQKGIQLPTSSTPAQAEEAKNAT